MPLPNSFGPQGEDLAAKYLLSHGYKILDRNFRTKYGEVDIVASGSGILVFVEVKTRTNKSFGAPIESVPGSKLTKLIKTAQYYVSTHKNLPKDYRLDVVEVFYSGAHFTIEHTQNITI